MILSKYIIHPYIEIISKNFKICYYFFVFIVDIFINFYLQREFFAQFSI